MLASSTQVLLLGHTFRVHGYLAAIVVAADVAGNIGQDAKTDPDPIKTVQRKDNDVHQRRPRGKDQAGDAYQPGQVKGPKGSIHLQRRNQPVDQEGQARPKE